MEFNTQLYRALVDGSLFLVRIVPIFAVSVYLAHLLEKMGWLWYLDRIAVPLMRLGNLNPNCGASFITSIVSPTAGHSMLADLRARGNLNRCELTIAAIVNNLPGEISTGKSILPLAVPVLGIYGVVYYGLLLVACGLKATIMLLVGRIIFDKPKTFTASVNNRQSESFWAASRLVINPSVKVILKTLRTMIPVAYLVYYLIAAGFFDKAANYLSFITAYLPLNPLVMPVVASRLLSPAGAYTVAGGLLASGTVSGSELSFALFAGAFISTLTSLRYTIPYYCGIFGASDGAVIIGVSLLSRTLAYGIVLFVTSFFIC